MPNKGKKKDAANPRTIKQKKQEKFDVIIES